MDVVRLHAKGRTYSRNAVMAVVAAALLGAGIWGALVLVHPPQTGPAVDRSELTTDVVRRGTFVRAVRAPGTFVSERIAVVAATGEGIVTAVAVKPGASVAQGSTIAQLSSPELDATIVDLQAQIVAAREEIASAQQQARSAHLDSLESADAMSAEREQAETEARSYATLHAQGLIGDLQYRISQIKARALRGKEAVERSKIGVTVADSSAKIAVAQAKAMQLQGQLAAREADRASLRARAGSFGVVQSVPVQVGQRVTAGTELARVADQRDLKAVLLVPEADAHTVTLGLPATIDSGSGAARGRVVRIDPAAQNGTVAVDVAFPGSAPAGARPDVHVDGSIELERIADALSIARPANAADNSAVDLYRIAGDRAMRVRVRLGRGSAERVQILSGMRPGDTVIISDTSAYNNAETLLLR